MTEANETEETADAASEAKTPELDILRQSLAESKAKSADFQDQLLRLRAEFENYRRRVEKEKTEARRWGKEEIILRLLSILDVMEQAESAAHKSPDLKSVVLGLDMLYKEFKRMLKEEGLEEVAAAPGDTYSHETQEAVETVEDDGEAGKILTVLQKGYKFNGNLFRPARVKITAKKSAKAAAAESNEISSTKTDEGSPD